MAGARLRGRTTPGRRGVHGAARRSGAAALVAGLVVGGLALLGDPPAKAAGTTVTFAAAGDWGASSGSTDPTLRSIGAARPNFALALGDLSYELETPTAWCTRVKNQLNAGAGRPAGDGYGETFPFEAMIGNHDVPAWQQYRDCLPDRLGVTAGPAGYPRQYRVDRPAKAPVMRLITLGSTTQENYGAGSADLAWVAASIDAARTRGIPWVVVAVHENYVSVGQNDSQVPAALMTLLLDKKVDLVLQGHDHNYQRSKQFVTGTGCPVLPTGRVGAACIAGNGTGGAYTKGRGTVVLVVGTGGRGSYQVSAADPEAGYFAAHRSDVFGWARVTATPTTLSGSFVRTGGVAYSDAWSIGARSTPADVTAPTAPTALRVTAVTGADVRLAWRPGTDAAGVVGHQVLRDGVPIGAVEAGNAPAFTDTAPAAATSSYTVVAVDAAGNASSAARPASVTVPAVPATASTAGLAPVADATVSETTPDAAGGSATALAASTVGGRAERSYLRFTVPPLGLRRVTSARLELRATDPSTSGGTLWTTSEAWTESAVRWQTSPPAGSWLGRFGAATTGGLQSLDLTGAVPGPGTYSFLLSSSAADRVGYASREGPVWTRPALVLGFSGVDGADPTAPGTPIGRAGTTGRVDLRWAAATDDIVVTGYQVERDGSVVTTRSTSSWIDLGRTSGSNPTYRVRALDGAGRAGPWSAPARVTVP